VTKRPPHNDTDESLVKLTLSGDRHAFSTIIKNTEGLVAQIIFNMVKIQSDRKDIVQDVYLKVFRNLAGFKFQSKLSTWIAQIAYNTCLHYIRKKKLVLIETFKDDEEEILNSISQHEHLQNNSTQSSAEKNLQAKELSSILQFEVEKLSPVFQTLIKLYHNEELSYAEVSQITSLPVGTIKSYLSRARKVLQINLLSTYKRDDL
jgi:RNA polymerase sigma factor (sigma-70 family)